MTKLQEFVSLLSGEFDNAAQHAELTAAGAIGGKGGEVAGKASRLPAASAGGQRQAQATPFFKQSQSYLLSFLQAGSRPIGRSPVFLYAGKEKSAVRRFFLRDSFKGIRIPMRSRKA